MGAAINFQDLIVVVEIKLIISRKSDKRIGLFVKVACVLIFLKFCNNLHFSKFINHSFSLVRVYLVQNLEVGFSRRECDGIYVVKVTLKNYTGFFKTVN